MRGFPQTSITIYIRSAILRPKKDKEMYWRSLFAGLKTSSAVEGREVQKEKLQIESKPGDEAIQGLVMDVSKVLPLVVVPR